MIRLAVFASGSGTNARNLIEYFNYGREGREARTPETGKAGTPDGADPEKGRNSRAVDARIEIVICNKPDAYVLTRARELNVPARVMDRTQLCGEKDPEILEVLRRYRIDGIILAGYLLKIPHCLIQAYPGRIINIHPALLPKFGGKGMYGPHVHEAVVAAGEKESGITVHLVNEHYDSGRTLFQAVCTVAPDETPETLAAKIHELEQAHFPKAVERYLENFFQENL